jgi:hypothetical protein
MGARPYNPTLGQFVSEDPIEGGTPNNYVYPADPINQSDITGQYCLGMDANGFTTWRGKGIMHGDETANFCTGAFKTFINRYTGRGNADGPGLLSAALGAIQRIARTRVLQTVKKASDQVADLSALVAVIGVAGSASPCSLFCDGVATVANAVSGASSYVNTAIECADGGAFGSCGKKLALAATGAAVGYRAKAVGGKAAGRIATAIFNWVTMGG